jgi:inner membrane protein
MMRRSHVLIGTVGYLALNGWSSLPVLALGLSGAVLGSFLPDWDLKLHIKHRTITHWIWWPLLLWFLVPGVFPHALALGWLLHIGADLLTVEGLAPFWPLPWRIRGLVRTGSFGEFVIVGCLFVFTGLGVLYL